MMERPPQRILITGAAGFVGTKLAARLRQRLPQAHLILADRAGANVGVTDGHRVDVSDAPDVARLIAEVRPTTVVHLAAISAVTSSTADPRRAWQINTMGTLNIVLSILDYVPDCHLVFVSSAEVYGRSAFDGRPVREDALLQPANPYATTKAAADLLVQEVAGRNLFATILRPFNHTGPGQAENFAVPSFCRQIVEIERGLHPPVIRVGELDDMRDFLDVEDVVDLYADIVEIGHDLANREVFNVASGTPRRMGDILDFLLSQSSTRITVAVDPCRLRSIRVPKIIGDASRVRQALKWEPRKAFDETLRETLAYWRCKPIGLGP